MMNRTETMGNCNGGRQRRSARHREAAGLFSRLAETEKQLASLKVQLSLVMDNLQTVQMLAEKMFPKELEEYKRSVEKGGR